MYHIEFSTFQRITPIFIHFPRVLMSRFCFFFPRMSESERYGFWFLAVSIKEMIIILCTPTFLINSIRRNSDTKWLSWHWFCEGIDNYSRLINLICFGNRCLSARRSMLWFIFIFSSCIFYLSSCAFRSVQE